VVSRERREESGIAREEKRRSRANLACLSRELEEQMNLMIGMKERETL